MKIRKMRVVLAKNKTTGVESMKQNGFNTTGACYIGRPDFMDGLDDATIFVHPSALERNDWGSFAKKINIVNRTLGTLRVIFL